MFTFKLALTLDCFDGGLPAWSIGTSPNAELANSSLEAACGTLSKGQRPVAHSDSKNVASRFCGNRNGAVSCSRDRIAAS